MQHPRRRPRTPNRQLDLFVCNPPPTLGMALGTTPGWNTLPDQTRQALTGLMTRMLVAHAGDAAPESGSDGDER